MAGSARIDELKKKFDENPGRYFAPLANEYRKAGEIEQAITICRTYLAEKPGHMSGLIVFGQALFEARQFEEARTTFEQALALDPENLIALRHLGDIARDVGDPAAARGWYQRVLDADPRNEEIAAQLAAVSAEAAAAPAGSSSASAASESGGMSGWGDINPEHSPSALESASAANTLVFEPVKPPADPIAINEDAAPQSLELISIEEPAAKSDIERDEPSLGFEPTSFTPASASSEEGSLGIERTQEFGIPGSQGSGIRGGDLELDRPFESPTDIPSTPSNDLGLEVTEFTPPSADEAPTSAELRTSLVFEPSAGFGGDLELADTPPGPGVSSVVSETPKPQNEQPVELAGAHAKGGADREAPGPAGFVTETMAELYLAQGYRAEAASVYRQLVEQNPMDSRLRDKLRRLESAEDTSADEASVPARSSTPSAISAVNTSGATEAIPSATPPTSRPAASGRSARAFFGALGTRKAPHRASDSYVNTFEAPAASAASESGVTGPADWIMEPAAAASATPADVTPVDTPTSATPELTGDAFGGSADAWPDVEPAETASSADTSGATGWGIAPVTDAPIVDTSGATGWGIAPVTEAPVADVATHRETEEATPATPVRSPTPPRIMLGASEKSDAGSASRTGEASEPTDPASGSLDALFAGASVKSADDAAASMLAGAFAAPDGRDTSAPTPPTTPQRGQPTRAASTELSLDHVFRDSPRKSGAVRQTGGFSFDQFFADNAANTKPNTAPSSDTDETPAVGSEKNDDEVGQFTSWLQGLKKK